MPDLPQLVLFDLDGTLIDTAPDLAHAVNTTLSAMQRQTYPEETIRNWIGSGIEVLLHRALTGNDHGEADDILFTEAYTRFLEAYEQNNGEFSHVYPGVISCLQTLQQLGLPMAVVTNKRARFSEPLLSNKDLDRYFDLILSGDSLAEKKPHPLPLLHAAQHFQAEPNKSIMVGDSINDVSSAQAAGFRVLCVDYGYNRGQNINDSGPDWVVDSLDRLSDLIKNNDA